MTKTSRQEIGCIGEDLATEYLEKGGFEIVERNYLRKWGEIDIIARKSSVLYFVEVKTRAVDLATRNREWYRPEENLHGLKLQRIKRAIQSFLFESRVSIESSWEFSVVTVILNQKNRELHQIEHLENLII
jgi:putative endonuclease